MSGHLRGQQRFDLLHLVDDILDRRAAQLIIEQITAGLDILDAHIGVEMKSLVFRMPVVGDEDRHGAAAGDRDQLDMLQKLVLALRP